jgi:hypothetical protein
MPIYVHRDGKLVDRETGEPLEAKVGDLFTVRFPTPRVSRMEPYESPITGKEVTSWGERDRELKQNNCYDPRDVSKPYEKGREAQKDDLKNARPGDPTDFWR